MNDNASPPGLSAPTGALEAVLRTLAGALVSGGSQSAQAGDPTGDRPLLDLDETAELLGVSRMTVARMTDEGRLPSVVIRRGRVQKMRRIPRAFVDRLVADACGGAQVDMEEYAAAWLAEHGLSQPAGEPDLPS